MLTGTLLWGIMIQVAVAYFTTTSPHTVRPLIAGRGLSWPESAPPANEILTAALCWGTIGGALAAGEPDTGRARRCWRRR